MRKPPVAWTTWEIQALESWQRKGFTEAEISKRLERPASSVRTKCVELGIILKRVNVKRDEPKAKNEYSYKESTPFDIARYELSDRFEVHNGITYYKGKVVNGLRDWHIIMRDCNARRKANGLPQITKFSGWVV